MNWQHIEPKDLRSPEHYLWYSSIVRDLIQHYDCAIYPMQKRHIRVPENFWNFEDRNPDDDPDWGQPDDYAVRDDMNRNGWTKQLALKNARKRWRLVPEINPVERDMDAYFKECAEMALRAHIYLKRDMYASFFPEGSFCMGPRGAVKLN